MSGFFGDLLEKYKAGAQESNSLGPELREKKRMLKIGQQAISGQSDDTQPQTTESPSRRDLVNPNYKPVGGQNAVDKLMKRSKFYGGQ